MKYRSNNGKNDNLKNTHLSTDLKHQKLIPRRSTLTFAVAGLDFGVFGDTPSWNLRLGVF